jgi:hypothetical protein
MHNILIPTPNSTGRGRRKSNLNDMRHLHTNGPQRIVVMQVGAESASSSSKSTIISQYIAAIYRAMYQLASILQRPNYAKARHQFGSTIRIKDEKPTVFPWID